MTEADAPEFDEHVVRRILDHCLANLVNGPPKGWRDLPPDVIHRVTEADVREATRRVKQASRGIAQAMAEACDG